MKMKFEYKQKGDRFIPYITEFEGNMKEFYEVLKEIIFYEAEPIKWEDKEHD